MIALMVPADMPPLVQVLRQSAVRLERQHGYIRPLQMAGQVARVDTSVVTSRSGHSAEKRTPCAAVMLVLGECVSLPS